jgi:hypothetical protein
MIELTPEQTKQVETLAAVLTTEQIAKYLGISPRTFDRLLLRQPEVRTAYDKGRSKALAFVGQELLKHARDGNIAAIIFYLKAQGGWADGGRNLSAQDAGAGEGGQRGGVVIIPAGPSTADDWVSKYGDTAKGLAGQRQHGAE